jgi:hypothetical protein
MVLAAHRGVSAPFSFLRQRKDLETSDEVWEK